MFRTEKVNHYYIMDIITTKYENGNLIISLMSEYNILYFIQIDIYKIVTDIIKNSVTDTSYLLKINSDFHITDYINYIKNKYNDISLIKHDTINILKIFDKVIVLTDDINLFLNLTKKKALNKFKKDYSIKNMNVIGVYKEKESEYVTKILLTKKKIKFILKDCLEELIEPVLLAQREHRYINLIKLIRIKKKYNIDVPFDTVYRIHENYTKIKININTKFNVEKYLNSKLFNQSEAIKSVTSVINSYFRLKHYTNKPLGSWLLCGPSGTGKTELAKVLAYSMFNSKDNFIKIDMSEYMEPHSISKLIGSPPGYSDYGSETILSKKFKSNSSFVIVFDEIEKAYKDFTTIMLQILDEGKLFLSNGETLNFNKSFIIFTSNLGCSENVKEHTIDKSVILEKINDFFRIEFLNRLTNILIFNPIDKFNSYKVLAKFIDEYSIKLNMSAEIGNNIKNDFIKTTYNELHGSRPLRRIVDNIVDKFDLYSNKTSINKPYNINYCFNKNKTNQIKSIFNSLCA